MRHHLSLAACSLIVLASFATPASAVPTNSDTVTFNGTLTDSCTVTATSAGTIAAAANGLSMGTEESGGSAAGLSVSAIGTPPQVDFTAPSLVSAPAGYSGTPTSEIKFSATGASGQTSYTSSTSSSLLSGLSATYTVHGRVTDSAGLPGGDYTMTTVATCSTPT